jgi:predicted metalloprotease with PDZ domain
MPKPQNHYFEVEMELRDFKSSEVTVKMPVWAPVSMAIRSANHVQYGESR